MKLSFPLLQLSIHVVGVLSGSAAFVNEVGDPTSPISWRAPELVELACRSMSNPAWNKAHPHHPEQWHEGWVAGLALLSFLEICAKSHRGGEGERQFWVILPERFFSQAAFQGAGEAGQ